MPAATVATRMSRFLMCAISCASTPSQLARVEQLHDALGHRDHAVLRVAPGRKGVGLRLGDHEYAAAWGCPAARATSSHHPVQLGRLRRRRPPARGASAARCWSEKKYAPRFMQQRQRGEAVQIAGPERAADTDQQRGQRAEQEHGLELICHGCFFVPLSVSRASVENVGERLEPVLSTMRVVATAVAPVAVRRRVFVAVVVTARCTPRVVAGWRRMSRAGRRRMSRRLFARRGLPGAVPACSCSSRSARARMRSSSLRSSQMPRHSRQTSITMPSRSRSSRVELSQRGHFMAGFSCARRLRRRHALYLAIAQRVDNQEISG